MRSVERLPSTDAVATALIGAAVPALAALTPLETAAWCGALILGAALGPLGPFGWTSAGWLTAIIVPWTPPASVAGAGALGTRNSALLAAPIGAAAAFFLPPLWMQPGVLLIGAGIVAACVRLRSPK